MKQMSEEEVIRLKKSMETALSLVRKYPINELVYCEVDNFMHWITKEQFKHTVLEAEYEVFNDGGQE